MRLAMVTLLGAACVSLGLALPVQASDWSPRAYADEDTVQLGVVPANNQPHWFKVWVVVVDDQAYVRLGGGSAAKIEGNKNKPYLGVRVAGQEFARIKGEPAPEMSGRVAEAMAAKYWSDLFVHLIDHPLTLRLVPE